MRETERDGGEGRKTREAKGATPSSAVTTKPTKKHLGGRQKQSQTLSIHSCVIKAQTCPLNQTLSRIERSATNHAHQNSLFDTYGI